MAAASVREARAWSEATGTDSPVMVKAPRPWIVPLKPVTVPPVRPVAVAPGHGQRDPKS